SLVARKSTHKVDNGVPEVRTPAPAYKM
ncbi:hypothetical protein A2U01_0067396, partial [Trifolium medium]|nr:hypothetical protein [Trifolium medium]